MKGNRYKDKEFKFGKWKIFLIETNDKHRNELPSGVGRIMSPPKRCPCPSPQNL